MKLRDLPIRRKLTLITMISSTIALVLACGAFVAYDVTTSREQMVKDLTMHADIVGSNSTAALSFGRPEDAREILESLGVEPHITDAAIYEANGRLFASFSRSERPVRPDRDPFRGNAFRDQHLELTRPIVLDGREIGSIYARMDLRALYARITRYALINVLVFLGATAVAYGLVVWLQRVITDPVLHLADTARTISAEKNYAVRALKQGDDELGVLIDCFNEMLDQIQERDAELSRHREQLEEKVQRRTEELRNVNVQLQVERDRAEEASRAKSAFLANMSHEIRTPMTAILGYTEMLLEPDPAPEERKDHLQTIRRNARHLMDLINDILDISKIEAGKMTVERLRCDLPQLVGEVISLMRPRAIEKGLRCYVVVRTPIPRWVLSDPLRLRQILVNLIGNAIKFTATGSIGIELSCEQRDGDNLLGFAVLDSGIGIHPDQLGKLFQPFTQADSSTTRRFGGTGLGLAISHRLATLLGGDITATSTPGGGSTFVLSINGGSAAGVEMVPDLATVVPPAATNAAAIDGATAVSVASALVALPPTNSPNHPARLCGRILLAEDGPDNQVLISTHLRRAGAEVVIAPDGKAAVEAACAQHFDLIIMDMQMPVMDGYSATAELRRLNYHMPIIALTAHAMSGDREKCIKAGCTDYLAKPIEKLRLLGAIHHYLRQGTGWPPPASSASSPRPAGGAPASSDRLVSAFKDDPDLVDVLDKFVSSLPERVQRLNELLSRKDLAELGRLVHQMKGASGGYGFSALSSIASKAEQKIKRKEPLEAIAADVDELIATIRRVEGYVEPTGSGTRAPRPAA